MDLGLLKNANNNKKIFPLQLPFKESTQAGRGKGASRTYTLRTCLPSQKVILAAATNKSQLIDLICEDLRPHKGDFSLCKLVVTPYQ